ncbi:HAMP domain-containing sensor histidine kinase [Aquidulcibacter sp.]|uniref:sensor histidine kinase n=1 Tax=Aquidulcibacter sp. TaxID=2052990 RepID=UPI0025BB3207|nr:HAMP domain-containing sensor histidine kinase [Aquidulcibacter sp.]MCA3696592.1 HAMP domain-containing histidine kinase [Aquidulcibacter sp.]
MSKRSNSLKVRLFALAALWNGLALGFSWVALSLLFERHTERQVTAELIRQGEALVAGMSMDAAGKPVLGQTLYDPRFTRPASGLYWYVSSEKGNLRSRSLWDGAWPSLTQAPSRTWESLTTKGPFEPAMLRVARTIRPDAKGPELLIEVGQDHAVITQARRDFAQELAFFLLLLWSVLTLASLVQVTQGLQPLAALRARLTGLKADSKARLESGEHPQEVGPLIQAINALADARSDDMARARDRARDLAHALKTPLTALKMQVGDLGDAKSQTALQESLSVLNIAVQAELARAQLAPDARGTCLLRPVIERLVRVVGRTPAGSSKRFEIEVREDCLVPLTEESAFEVLGALLDNATRHATHLIKVRARVEGGGLMVTVEDDGPGLSQDQSQMAIERGVRLDEAIGTQGLGLAITRDFIAASSGTLILETSDLGGLAVRLGWAQVPT